MVFDPSGNLWAVVTGNRGTDHSPSYYMYFYKISNDTASLISTINAPPTSMAIASDSSIWIGTYEYSVYDSSIHGGGLYHYANGSTIKYSTENGLIDNTVTSVAITGDGAVWAGMPSGITRYGEPLESFPTYVAETSPIPMSLLRNHPNPFNASTIISFALPSPGEANLSVYSITGQKIRTLVSGKLPAGTHTARWDGRDDSGRPVSSGVYISRLRAGNTTATARMLLLK